MNSYVDIHLSLKGFMKIMIQFCNRNLYFSVGVEIFSKQI